jgi:L-asparaginase II
MTFTPDTDYVVEDRGGIVENRHQIHAAVTTPTGELLYAVGDPTRLTLIRSAAKPAQSVAVLEALASPSPTSTLPPSFTLSDADVALMSASHSSEPAHLAHAAALLERGGNSPADLKCGGHAAISPAVNDQWIRDGVVPEGIHNNCSGKHAGMLAAARALGADKDYHLPAHPVQQRVRGVVEDLVGPLGEVRWAVDGCNLPAPAMPLTSLAAMYAAFAAARPGPGREGVMARVFGAMHAHPFQVSGGGRFCAAVARIPGVVGKVGADACYGVGVRGREIGIAVKVEDGNLDILYAAVAEILERLGVGTEEERRGMEVFHRVERRNTAGVKVGGVSFPFVLRDMRV